MVVSSEGSLVRPVLENIKLVNCEDTAFLAWEDRVLLQVIVTVVLIEVCGKNFAVIVQCSYGASENKVQLN